MEEQDETERRAIEKAMASFRLGELNQARAVARETLDKGIEAPFLLKVEALWLQQEGRLQESLRAYHHARTLDVHDPAILYGIASVLSEMGEYEKALQIVEEVLKANPAAASIHYLKGRILDKRYQYKLALLSYEKAEQLAPKSAAVLAAMAANCFSLGNLERASKLSDKALILQADEPTANITLSRISLEQGLINDAEVRLSWLLSKNINQNVNSLCYGFLGDVYDAQDETKKAFQAYKKSNDLKLQLRHDISIKAASVKDRIEKLDHILNSSKFSINRKSNEEIKNPVFLIGFMRSGTTLIEQTLASHPNVVTLEERNLLNDFANDYLSSGSAFSKLQSLGEQKISSMREAYWSSARKFKEIEAGKIFIDKNPLNTLMLPLIRHIFPTAKIIFAIRDPRDVILSCFRRQLAIDQFTFNFLSLINASQFYNYTMNIGVKCLEKSDSQAFLIRYEDLVDHFSDSIMSICNYLNLEWTETLLDFHNKVIDRDIASFSATQLRAGLNKKTIGRWKDYSDDLSPVFNILAPWVKHWGYSDSSDAQ